MTTISFSIPGKENERRRSLLPGDVAAMRNPGSLYFEEGFGEILGIGDHEYVEAGAHVVPRQRLADHQVLCCMKAPSTDERELYAGRGHLLFGWIHAVQGRSITDWLVDNRMSAIAWEDMFSRGRHVFWRNNEIAGQAAVAHASLLWGRNLRGLDVALIGRGNTARGAFGALCQSGANVTTYDRSTSPLLSEEVDRYDLVVNAVLWDVFRDDHLISRADLKRMRPGAMIVDISCDEGMAVETSRATTIDDPVYEVDGVLHYAVDHTPALLFRDSSAAISQAVAMYIDELASDQWGDCLRDALIIKDGRILDSRISRFQQR